MGGHETFGAKEFQSNHEMNFNRNTVVKPCMYTGRSVLQWMFFGQNSADYTAVTYDPYRTLSAFCRLFYLHGIMQNACTLGSAFFCKTLHIQYTEDPYRTLSEFCTLFNAEYPHKFNIKIILQPLQNSFYISLCSFVLFDCSIIYFKNFQKVTCFLKM